jgi:hypothetical protein
MAKCDLHASCYFLNEITVVRPITTGHARGRYCDGDFTSCTIYKVAQAHGIDKVPRYVYPSDTYEFNSKVAEHVYCGDMTW